MWVLFILAIIAIITWGIVVVILAPNATVAKQKIKIPGIALAVVVGLWILSGEVSSLINRSTGTTTPTTTVSSAVETAQEELRKAQEKLYVKQTENEALITDKELSIEMQKQLLREQAKDHEILSLQVKRAEEKDYAPAVIVPCNGSTVTVYKYSGGGFSALAKLPNGSQVGVNLKSRKPSPSSGKIMVRIRFLQGGGSKAGYVFFDCVLLDMQSSISTSTSSSVASSRGQLKDKSWPMSNGKRFLVTNITGRNITGKQGRTGFLFRNGIRNKEFVSYSSANLKIPLYANEVSSGTFLIVNI